MNISVNIHVKVYIVESPESDNAVRKVKSISQFSGSCIPIYTVRKIEYAVLPVLVHND